MAISNTNIRMSITLPKDLKATLDELAKEDRRTTSNYIVNILSTHIDNLDDEVDQ